jgi:uncharacterized RDD family membrane protein YckC
MEQAINPPDTSVIYAGFWIRAAAFIIDLLIAGTIAGIISRILFSSYYMYDDSGNNPGPGAVSLIVNWIYFAWQESSVRQATIGKLVVDVKVCTENGERLSFANATGRYFAKILSTIILLIGFLMVAFDKKAQGLHDKLAKTFVIYR